MALLKKMLTINLGLDTTNLIKDSKGLNLTWRKVLAYNYYYYKLGMS